MTQCGELFSASVLTDLESKCPFGTKKDSGPKRSDENIPDDDKDSVQEIQDNNGGTLGDNVEKGMPGVADGGPEPPTRYLFKQAADDSRRGQRRRLRLKEFGDAKSGYFPFTVAAHHLIPGNAALYNSEVGLINFMEDGGKVQSITGRQLTIDGHIGYDVNGSHNGVWLPGNYAIKAAKPRRRSKKTGKVIPAKAGTTPVKGLSWEDLSNSYEPWQYAYVASACKAAKGQFHDSHERPYSASVRRNLMKIVVALATHLDSGCEECKKKTKVSPPFRVKRRLYQASKKLRGYVVGPPGSWKRPWFTSERWSGKFFSGGRVTAKFKEAYAEAMVVGPDEPWDDDDE